METVVALVLGLALGLALGAGAATAWARRRRQRLERALEESQRRLEAARSASDAFFDITTHELRAPLSAVLGYQELLQDGAYGTLPEPAQDAVRRIGRSGHHLLNLIDGVIELGRLRAGSVRPDLGAVDLGAIFSSLAQELTTRAAERGITAHAAVQKGLPVIRSDQDRLVRAIELLIASAVRHPDGDLSLAVEIEGGHVIMTLGPVDIATEPDTAPYAHGSGIRLAVAAGIAGVLGGRLELPDEAGRVRSLVLRVPVQPPEPAVRQGL